MTLERQDMYSHAQRGNKGGSSRSHAVGNCSCITLLRTIHGVMRGNAFKDDPASQNLFISPEQPQVNYPIVAQENFQLTAIEQQSHPSH